jgi:glycosyltransferase involved in cell wall biosynthesis
MRRSHELRIVIPAYNEEQRIRPTLADYCSEFRETGTVVVVANGCSDATADVVRALQAEFENLALIEIPNAIGKGGAVRVGLATGGEEYVGFADADGSTSAAEFRRLFEELRASGADALVGSRWLAASRVTTPQGGARRLASRGFNAIVRLLFGLRIRDTQCGAKLFRRSALRNVLGGLEVANFAFDIEVLVRLQQTGCRVVEAPTVWSDMAAGTKIHLLRSSWSMLKSVLRMRLRDSALWQIPMVDRFGRSGVIPVKDGRRILVFGAAEACGRALLDPFFARLRETGVAVSYAEVECGRRRLSPLRALLWYALRSPRRYDALVEIGERSRWLVPQLSIKPAFLVVTREASSRSRRRHFAGRATIIDLTNQQAHAAVETLLATVYADPSYPAVFMNTPQDFSLQYADRKTVGVAKNVKVVLNGTSERQVAGERREYRFADGRVSVVMPAFNESGLIARSLREVVATFEEFGADFEVILVDDGSHDDTHLHALRVLADHPERIRVLRYEVNQGKGNALMAGAVNARGEYVVFLDSDMDIHPSQLPTFFEIMRRTRADAVIGSKRHPQSQVKYPLIRQIYSTGYYTMVRVLFGLPLRDTQTGLKLFHAELLRDVLPRVMAKRFAFDIELLSIAHHLGYRIADAPVVLGFNRRYGRINYREVWRIFLDTLAIFYRLRVLHYYDTKHVSNGGGSAVREMSDTDAPELVKVADS